MNVIKTPEEIAVMSEGGKKLGIILSQLLSESKEGVNILDIEKRAQELIALSGGSPSFTTVAGYKWATCLCVNDAVVHGVPKNYVLKSGDVFTIDMGLLYQGFHTDTAWTKVIIGQETGGGSTAKKKLFLKVGEEALWKAISVAVIGNRIGHISEAIQSTVEGAGFSIVKTLTGHGVGRQLHEAPQVPNYIKGTIENTPQLMEGMTIAIEPIYAKGRGDIIGNNKDGWTLSMFDGSLSAQFEHTIAITEKGPRILTGDKSCCTMTVHS